MRIMEIGDTYNAPADCPIPKEHVAVSFMTEEVAYNKKWHRHLYGESAYLDEPIIIEGLGVYYPLICDKREVKIHLLGHALSAEEIREIANNT
jgi:hypothetical protein